MNTDYELYKKRGFFDGRWSSGVTKRILPGDRVFLIRLGSTEPVGIMASGFALTAPFQEVHYSKAGRLAWYIQLHYDILLYPQKEKILERSVLETMIPSGNWSPRASGMTITPESATVLEGLWIEHLRELGLSPVTYPEEVDTPERFWEGALRRITVNAYERDPRARKACIDHYGFKCQICQFDFVERYGAIGKEFIHVHHLTQLNISKTYLVNPVEDLLPVCPNCHAMIHRENPCLTPHDLKQRLKKITQ